MAEAKCESCGAIYTSKNEIPKDIRCLCKSKKFKMK